jgi:protein-disulfide isomerase
MDSNQMKNYVIVSLATALLVLGLVWIRDGGNNGAALPNAPTAAAAGGQGATGALQLDESGNYFKGDKDAPVTLYEFSDYQCPFCGRWWSGTLPDIEEQYIKTGKVKLVFKDFPLDSIHPEATPAAIAARCAGDQGQFWEMHDLIFQNQASLSTANYKLWATQLNLDAADFNSCLDTRQHLSAVRKDLVEGQQNGIRGTPGFLLNGEVISGAQPFSVFQQAIDRALAQN